MRVSPSSGGAWIETSSYHCPTSRLGRPPPGGRGLKRRIAVALHVLIVSPSSGGAWIETDRSRRPRLPAASPSSGGAWIETCRRLCRSPCNSSPSSGGAWIETGGCSLCRYAIGRRRPPPGGRGLKPLLSGHTGQAWMSPSSGGAWIETTATADHTVGKRRPPPGGRGLKHDRATATPSGWMSPSSGGAWIETSITAGNGTATQLVALLRGGVD